MQNENNDISCQNILHMKLATSRIEHKAQKTNHYEINVYYETLHTQPMILCVIQYLKRIFPENCIQKCEKFLLYRLCALRADAENIFLTIS